MQTTNKQNAMKPITMCSVIYGSVSESHKCGFGIGIGFIQFDQLTKMGKQRLLTWDTSTLDSIQNTALISSRKKLIWFCETTTSGQYVDTVELYTDVGADLWLHYFEDRSNTIEGGTFGNTTDSKLWIRGLPSGALPQRRSCHLYHDWRGSR